jgi:hypothetical protein
MSGTKKSAPWRVLRLRRSQSKWLRCFPSSNRCRGVGVTALNSKTPSVSLPACSSSPTNFGVAIPSSIVTPHPVIPRDIFRMTISSVFARCARYFYGRRRHERDEAHADCPRPRGADLGARRRDLSADAAITLQLPAASAGKERAQPAMRRLLEMVGAAQRARRGARLNEAVAMAAFARADPMSRRERRAATAAAARASGRVRRQAARGRAGSQDAIDCGELGPVR